MMKKLKRTTKEINMETLDDDFIKRALSIGGIHSLPLKLDISDFEISESYINKRDDGKGSISPYRGEVEGHHKFLQGLNISHKSFDTKIRILQNGRLLSMFKNGSRQYNCVQLDWINLLIEYGYIEYV